MCYLHVQKDGEVPPDNLYRMTLQLLKVLTIALCPQI